MLSVISRFTLRLPLVGPTAAVAGGPFKSNMPAVLILPKPAALSCKFRSVVNRISLFDLNSIGPVVVSTFNPSAAVALILTESASILISPLA